jgi:hypothetical protein
MGAAQVNTCPIAEILHAVLYEMAGSAKERDLKKYQAGNRTFERWREIYCSRNDIDPHLKTSWDAARDKICTYLTRAINDMPLRPRLLREAHEIADISLAHSS